MEASRVDEIASGIYRINTPVPPSAETRPLTLACMHGSAREGDGATLLTALADRLEA